jgi:hypothetical protein
MQLSNRLYKIACTWLFVSAAFQPLGCSYQFLALCAFCFGRCLPVPHAGDSKLASDFGNASFSTQAINLLLIR